VLHEEERGIGVIPYGIPDKSEEPPSLLMDILCPLYDLVSQFLDMGMITINSLSSLEKRIH
jgi:hypothetical protein